MVKEINGKPYIRVASANNGSLNFRIDIGNKMRKEDEGVFDIFPTTSDGWLEMDIKSFKRVENNSTILLADIKFDVWRRCVYIKRTATVNMLLKKVFPA